MHKLYTSLAATLTLITSSCSSVKTQTDSILNEANTNKQFEASVNKIERGYEVSSYASTTVMGITPYAALVVGYRKEPKPESIQVKSPAVQSK